MKTTINQARLKEYNELLDTPMWRKRRESILIRDHHQCVNCGSTHYLQVHHKQYHKINNAGDYKSPWDYADKYLITLCKSCHMAGHHTYQVPVFNV